MDSPLPDNRLSPNPADEKKTGTETAQVRVGGEDAFDSSFVNNDGPLEKRTRLPAVLVSTIVHTSLLILLALITLPDGAIVGTNLVARQGEQAEVFELTQIDPEELALDRQHDDASSQPVAIEWSDPLEALVSPPSPTVDAAAPLDSSVFETLAGGGSSGSSLLQIPSGGGLAGRTPDKKRQLAQKYGGTPESEQAVENALEYLARHQRSDGSWSFDLTKEPCNGSCRHSRKVGQDTTPSTAATGLALLAFLGAGHTHHQDGPYTENVRRGLYFLRAIASETQSGIDWQQGTMYGHGIALMAMSEAVAMTKDEDARQHEFYDLIDEASKFSCIAQHPNGSWGYFPGSPGDLTVTGWQVLSLVAAKRNAVQLQTYTLRDAKDFALSTRPEGQYTFGYKGPPAKPTTTAVGLTLMLYLGESPEFTPLFRSLSEMAERGPTLTNVYHDYYATLALHHSQHPGWDRWNTRLRDHLVQSQEKTGHEKGSWHFKDRWGDVGGRLYTTAMCTLNLEVYYRYLPLYDPDVEFEL